MNLTEDVRSPTNRGDAFASWRSPVPKASSVESVARITCWESSSLAGRTCFVAAPTDAHQRGFRYPQGHIFANRWSDVLQFGAGAQ